MKTPDKIFIQPRTIDELPHQNIVYTKRLSDASIEYIRKDALLEWAKEKANDYKGTANIRRSFELMIRKIDSL